MRFATECLELGGVTIPAGDIVLLALCAANRDGERFADPDSLDIERPTGGHLSFGHGIHFCLGAPLARMEAKIALGKLIERFPAIKLAVDPSDLRWRPSVVMHGLLDLPVWPE
jgi:cytochrome P450